MFSVFFFCVCDGCLCRRTVVSVTPQSGSAGLTLFPPPTPAPTLGLFERFTGRSSNLTTSFFFLFGFLVMLSAGIYTKYFDVRDIRFGRISLFLLYTFNVFVFVLA